MKYRFAILIFLPFCLILMGCPYKSQYPVESIAQPDDNRIAGAWTDFTSPDTKYVVGASKDGKHVIIEKKRNSDSSVTETMYYGTISNVSGTRFLNLFDTSGNKQGYYIYKIEYLTGSKLVLIPLSDSWMPDLKKPGQLKEWLLKNQYRSGFYPTDELVVYMKN